MMATNHTPGPWKFDESYMWSERLSGGPKYHFRVTGANGETWTPIALCQSNARAVDNEANARLIAAAPDLLEALQYAIKQVPELATVPGISSAISKATGQTK